MPSPPNHDELVVLIASFVEAIKPFFAGIRRGVEGLFAVPRETGAVSIAREALATIAASSALLGGPAARQLAELAGLVDQAFGAAERGEVPDEARAPLLLLVEGLERQLDGLPEGDGADRSWLDEGYRQLEQVRHVVEGAAAATPALEIDLDDLLLTLATGSVPALDTPLVDTSAPVIELADTEVPAEALPTIPQATTPPAPMIAAGALDEAAILALSAREMDYFLALDEAGQEAYLDESQREMAVFAADLGLTVAPEPTGVEDDADGAPDVEPHDPIVIATRFGTLAGPVSEAAVAPAPSRNPDRVEPVDLVVNADGFAAEPPAEAGPRDRLLHLTAAETDAGARVAMARARPVVESVEVLIDEETIPPGGPILADGGPADGAVDETDNDATIAAVADLLRQEYRKMASATDTPALASSAVEADMASRLRDDHAGAVIRDPTAAGRAGRLSGPRPAPPGRRPGALRRR